MRGSHYLWPCTTHQFRYATYQYYCCPSQANPILVIYFAQVTFGIFKGIVNDTTGATSTILVLDPSNYEEVVMDGTISFSINAQREVCSIMKPGGSGVTASEILGTDGLIYAAKLIVNTIILILNWFIRFRSGYKEGGCTC